MSTRITQSEIDFFKSFIAKESKMASVESVLQWLKKKTEEVATTVEIKPLNQLKQWTFDREASSLLYDSRKFFSIEGISVETNWGHVHT